MKTFMGDDFLLDSALAAELYGRVKDLPIVDYHCHLNPADIASNSRFSSLTGLWLSGDHYKWRLMRANGVPEEYITGGAPEYDKFLKWAETVQDLIGSPLYHWTHLELRRCFQYDGLLTAKTAPEIWAHCNSMLNGGGFRVWDILDMFNVEWLCTTDDPADDLRHHAGLPGKGLKTRVFPTFRPSHVFDVEKPRFVDYAAKLSSASGIAVRDYETLLAALCARADYFASMGCALSDCAFDPPVFCDYDEGEVNYIVIQALSGEIPEPHSAAKYKTALFVDLGRKYNELGWAMQIHINAARNNNSAMLARVGADCGCDSILDMPVAAVMNRLLDRLASRGALPKTILYNLNPAADAVMATLAGNFQGGAKGKLQYGAAWWFNDTKTGMERQMTTLANTGMLARFIGMLTDSRSFLSYTRHEYFRRIMCNTLATWVNNGEFPNDLTKLTEIASGIAYYNARDYFKL